MKKVKFLVLSGLLLSLVGLTSCKKDRTCTCSLTYFSSPDKTTVIPIGKATIKQGQNQCNEESRKIVINETSNGLSSSVCEVK
ncbi:MAG TPA: hypothetical protein PLP27_10820 [Crocinitomicaceae bacterium]|nr:hypothetical protein [Crocinitomicaceae bacterium]